MRYAVIIEKDEETGSYGAYAPDLPGCGAAGETLDEVIELIREAIQMHIELLRETGQSVPEPVTRVDYVEMA